MEMRLKAMDMQIEQIKAMAQVRTAQLDAADDEREHQRGNIEAARDLHIGGIEHEQRKELLAEQHKSKMKQAKEPKQ
jgi:predicted Ser/Thr protein kinase